MLRTQVGKKMLDKPEKEARANITWVAKTHSTAKYTLGYYICVDKR